MKTMKKTSANATLAALLISALSIAALATGGNKAKLPLYSPAKSKIQAQNQKLPLYGPAKAKLPLYSPNKGKLPLYAPAVASHLASEKDSSK